VSESSACKGLWVKCDICDAWQHADCVGYTAKEHIHFDNTAEDVASKNEKKMTRSLGLEGKRNPSALLLIQKTYMFVPCAWNETLLFINEIFISNLLDKSFLYFLVMLI